MTITPAEQSPDYTYGETPNYVGVVSSISSPVDEADLKQYIDNKIISLVIRSNNAINILEGRVSVLSITTPKGDSDASNERNVYLSVDLSMLSTLSEKTDLIDNNNLVSTYLNELYHDICLIGQTTSPKLNFMICRVDLNNNNVSGRSLLQDHSDLIEKDSDEKVGQVSHYVFREINPIIAYMTTDELNKALYRDIIYSITEVDFTHTNITFRGLKFMNRLPYLEKVVMDYCKNTTKFVDISSTACTKVKSISLIGTAICSVPDLYYSLGKKFPNVTNFEFTQPHFDGKDSKFLGLIDAITDQSTISPHILVPCGHIFSRENAGKQLKIKECWLCRNTVEKIVDGAIFQTRMTKEDDVWKVDVIDFNRNPLSDRVFYHPNCRQAFNIDTIESITKESFDKASDAVVIDACTEIECPGCIKLGQDRKLEIIRIFPTPTDKKDVYAASQQQTSLNSMDGYINS